jgi:hypothetical protein
VKAAASLPFSVTTDMMFYEISVRALSTFPTHFASRATFSARARLRRLFKCPQSSPASTFSESSCCFFGLSALFIGCHIHIETGCESAVFLSCDLDIVALRCSSSAGVNVRLMWIFFTSSVRARSFNVCLRYLHAHDTSAVCALTVRTNTQGGPPKKKRTA